MFERLKALRRLPGDITLAWRLFQDPRVSRQSKILAVAAIGLVLSPLDVFEWLPFAAPVSDLVLTTLILRTFINAAPEQVRLEHMDVLGIAEV